MTDTSGRYRFIAWSRRGLAAGIPTSGPTGGQAVLPVKLTVNAAGTIKTTDKVDLRFYGPGHVTGIDTREIVRVEPRPGVTDFEPNYLAACEFRHPYFPWLFSPEPSTQRLRPWVALIVLERDKVEIATDPRRPLASASIAAADAPGQLPDLTGSWAWAHIQLTGTDEAPEKVLAGAAELTLSRVLCPRRLHPTTAYRACLVPAYLAGVQAGLGQAVTAGAEPAWPPPAGWASLSGDFELPVYHSWEFTTAVEGDFEALARRLRPKPLERDIGGRPMDLTHAGAGLPVPAAGEPGSELSLEGVLGSPMMVPSEWSEEPRAAFQAHLADLLVAPPGVPETVLAPPIYGSHQAGTGETLPDEDEDPQWLRTLNLDPRFRVSGGLGTRVVQELQEQLMASAWDQAGELERANELRRQAQLARAAGGAAAEKHLAGVSSDALLRVTAPTHGRVRLGRDGKEPPERPPDERKQTLRGSIAAPESVFPDAAISPPFRRVTRPHGPVGRHLPGDAGEPTSELSQDLANGNARVPIKPPKGGAGFDEVADDLGLPKDKRPNVEQAKAKVPSVPDGRGFAKVAAPAEDGTGFYVGDDPHGPPPEPPPAPVEPVPVASAVEASAPAAGEPEPASAAGPLAAPGRGDSAAVDGGGPGNGDREPKEDTARRRERVRRINKRFKEAAKFLLDYLPVPISPTTPGTASDGVLELGEVRKGLIATGGVLDPDRTVAREVLPLVPDAPEPSTAAPGPEPDPLRIRAATPSFPQPMSEPLKAIDREMLLPGIEKVATDSVSIAVGNPRVIESYMAGLNHELSRELLWRGLPADYGATYFRQFWDVRGRGPDGAAQPATDIPPIADWHDKDLGENATRVGGSGMLVLLIRGQLLNRYPTTAIYAVKAVPKLGADGKPALDGDGKPIPAPGPQELYPEFRGDLPPDVTYLGFGIGIAEARGLGSELGWFFMLQEQPTAPRFGLDEPPEDGAGAEPPATWAGLHWGHPYPAGTDLRAVTHLPAEGRLAGVTRPVLAEGGPSATWGVDSAQSAAITYQRPMRVAIHARTMLEEPQVDPALEVVGAAWHDGTLAALAVRSEDGAPRLLDVADAADALRRGAIALYVAKDGDDRAKVIVADGGDGAPALTTERAADTALLRELPDADG